MLVSPFEVGRVCHSAYELSLGGEVVVSGNDRKTVLGPAEQICIPPGQFAHLLTDEAVIVPLDAIAFISMKTRLKQTGLINVSGFHVDPGYFGRLIFSVYNAGLTNIVLSRGTPTFLIWYADLDKTTDQPYMGVHQGQMAISNEMTMRLHGNGGTPPELARRLTDLESRVSRWFRVAAWIVAIIGGTLITAGVKTFLARLGTRVTDSGGQHSQSAPLPDTLIVGPPVSDSPTIER